MVSAAEEIFLLPAPVLGRKDGPPLIRFGIFLAASSPRLITDSRHRKVIRRTPADEEENIGFSLEVLLDVVRLKCDLPKIGRLAVHRGIGEFATDPIAVKFAVPLSQSGRRGPGRT